MFRVSEILNQYFPLSKILNDYLGNTESVCPFCPVKVLSISRVSKILNHYFLRMKNTDSVCFVSDRAELFHASLRVSLCHWCQHLPPHVFAIGRALTSMILRLCIIDSLRTETPIAVDPHMETSYLRMICLELLRKVRVRVVVFRAFC